MGKSDGFMYQPKSMLGKKKPEPQVDDLLDIIAQTESDPKTKPKFSKTADNFNNVQKSRASEQPTANSFFDEMIDEDDLLSTKPINNRGSDNKSMT